MDLHDFWQENKRWILGIALGFLVYLIGGTVIRDAYTDPGLSSTRDVQEDCHRAAIRVSPGGSRKAA